MQHRFYIIPILLTFTTVSLLFAQYKEEWSIIQPYLEWGVPLYDFNGDGTYEITKQFFNSFTAYNGADSFKTIWALKASNYDELLIYKQDELNAGQGKRAIFTANNSLDTVTTRILSYKPLAANPEWQTADFPGFYSVISVDDLDGIAGKELAVGINQYVTASSSYRSKFYILNGANGQIIFQSPWFSGYMIGPYTGNIDADPQVEIMLNLYFASDTTSALHIYTLDPLINVLKEEPLPNVMTVSAAFPNPFNSTASIPITMIRNGDAEVTVTDITGRTVATLLSGQISAGKHILSWDGKTAAGISASSGTYFCRIRVGSNETTRPLVLIR